MNIRAEIANHICQSSFYLAIAEFSREGKLLNVNKGFNLFFHGLAFEKNHWHDFFVSEMPMTGSQSTYQQITEETSRLKTTTGNELNCWFCYDQLSYYCIAEIHEIDNKRLLEEISELTNVMAQLNSQLRREKQHLLKATKELEKLALKDPLTGLLNRRAFFNTIEEKLSLAKRQNIDISLFFLDLDHFKSVNDKWGHDAGDALLIAISAMFKETIRLEDMAVRFGGEEFIIVLVGVSLDSSLEVAERIRTLCKNIRLNSIERTNTLSIGIAQWDKRETIHELITRADTACYRAKENGRDCFVVANMNVVS
ncbi:hypothetical protein GCM10007916_24930 [Psychromonas marina]|uniref:diguanylate cyclase n=1 Tax=Psychromonas marina TaxID=88364 RepID=A0ABQ6E1Z3_9GAMM|nr:GGDEF domain-containing protein [Psychromonas marina]GLS91424.1 hypothetical protein GCM10007916_24930 [Psychromonas marina]